MPTLPFPDPDPAGQRGAVILGGFRYTIQRHFGEVPASIKPARVSQVAIDAAGRLHMLRRGGDVPVLVFGSDGKFLFGYGEGRVFDSHGITIDHQDRVFVVDRDAHQVLCFASDGTPLFALGERHVPHWEDPFNHPTRVAVARDGEIYVADGYANARVHRFAPDGTYLSSFGTIGHGPGQFMSPHSIIIDRQDRILICDRENNRVQVFDRAGAWIASWDGLCRPMDLCERADGAILVTDQVPSVTAFAPDGTRLGRGRPSLNGAHGIARDQAGAIYLAEIDPTSVTKLVPIG